MGRSKHTVSKAVVVPPTLVTAKTHATCIKHHALQPRLANTDCRKKDDCIFGRVESKPIATYHWRLFDWWSPTWPAQIRIRLKPCTRRRTWCSRLAWALRAPCTAPCRAACARTCRCRSRCRTCAKRSNLWLKPWGGNRTGDGVTQLVIACWSLVVWLAACAEPEPSFSHFIRSVRGHYAGTRTVRCWTFTSIPTPPQFSSIVIVRGGKQTTSDGKIPSQ